jgi:hypothetical protein
MAQEKWLVDGPRVIDLELVTELKVGLIGGQVAVVGHDEPGARIEVHSVFGKELLISVDGSALEVDHPQLRWDNFLDVFATFRDKARADVTIMVPRDIALKLGVVTAEALVSGMAGSASLSTVSGDLVLDDHTGDVQLNAVSGEVSIRDHRGAVTVRTVSGDVTTSGAITRFACDGVSGDIFLDISGIPETIRLNTVSGAITTRLESGVPIRYTINTATGRLQLDDEHITRVHGQHTSSFGDLAARWVDFRANTVSGAVSVLHSVSV